MEGNPTVRIPEVSAAPAVKANGNVPSWDISQHLRLPPVVRVPEVSAVQRENALVGETENKTRAAAVLEFRHFSRRDTAVSLAVSRLFGAAMPHSQPAHTCRSAPSRLQTLPHTSTDAMCRPAPRPYPLSTYRQTEQPVGYPLIDQGCHRR